MIHSHDHYSKQNTHTFSSVITVEFQFNQDVIFLWLKKLWTAAVIDITWVTMVLVMWNSDYVGNIIKMLTGSDADYKMIFIAVVTGILYVIQFMLAVSLAFFLLMQIGGGHLCNFLRAYLTFSYILMGKTAVVILSNLTAISSPDSFGYERGQRIFCNMVILIPKLFTTLMIKEVLTNPFETPLSKIASDPTEV